MSRFCETCGQELEIDEIVAGDAVCTWCVKNWEKESNKLEAANHGRGINAIEF